MSLEDLGRRLSESAEATIVADACPSFVSVVDTSYVYRFVNQAYLDRTGKARHEIVGRTVEELWGKELFDELRQNLDRAFAGETLATEYHDRELGGVTSYIPIRVDDVVAGAWVFAADTRQIQRVRNAIIQRDKLASMNKLVAAVLHGMNTPLGALRGTLETVERLLERMAEEEQDAPRAVRKLQRVLAPGLAALTRTEGVLSDLASLVQLDRAELQIVDINTCLERALGLMEAVLGPDLIVDKQFGDCPPIPCRPAELTQIALTMLQVAERERTTGTPIELRTSATEASVHVVVAFTSATLRSGNLLQVVSGQSAHASLAACADTLSGWGGDLVATDEGDRVIVDAWLPRPS